MSTSSSSTDDEERGRGVGGPAAEPATRGDVLAQHQPHAVTGTTRPDHQPLGGDEGEVAVVGRDVVADLGAHHLHLHAARCRHRVRLEHVVRLAERDHERLEVVEAVGATAEHPQREVSFG